MFFQLRIPKIREHEKLVLIRSKVEIDYQVKRKVHKSKFERVELK